MAQNNTSPFKVSITNEGVNEVRRFNVEGHIIYSLKRFKEELQNVFPILRTNSFTVAWKDSDGDLITISSTEELRIALKEQKTEVRKLYVTVQDGPGVQGRRQLHVDVTCDACDGEVEGFRYKCLHCHDFDLCATCESKGLHPGHCMIRLTVSMSCKMEYFNRLTLMQDGEVKYYIFKT